MRVAARLEASLRSNPALLGLALLLLLLVVLNGVRQSHWKAIHNPNDFVTLYAGSVCMHSDCNPYSVPTLDAMLVARRGSAVRQDWSDQLPIYPPTTLALLIPFSFLPYTAATVLWYIANLGVYIFGVCWLCFRSSILQQTSLTARLLFALLALHFPKMLQCVGFGNPAVMITGLLLFALTADRSATRASFACLLLACLLKPPMALPVALVWLLHTSRTRRELGRRVIIAVAVFTATALYAFVPPGLAGWQHDLRANIALGERGGMSPSLRNSPSNVLLNLATLPGYFTHRPLLIQLASYAVFGALTLLLIIGARRSAADPRSWSPTRYMHVVAASAAITLLPVYHRFCDIGVLLLVVPWLLLQLRNHPRWQAWVSLFCMGGLYFSWERRINLQHLPGALFPLAQFLYYRGDAILVLLLCCVLISALFQSESGTLPAQQLRSMPA